MEKKTTPVNTKNVTKTKKESPDIKKIMYVVITTLIVIIIAVLIIMISNEKDNKDTNNNNTDNNNNSEGLEKVEAPSEETLINQYGMSKEKAIGVVQKVYNSDIYEFSAKITIDGVYEITAKNTLTNTNTQYLVDPATGNYYSK